MNFKERIRVISERFLDMAGFTSSPRNQAPYKFSNDLQRAIAHLAAFDGTYSRLLRTIESGVLRVQTEGSSHLPFQQGDTGHIKIALHLIGTAAAKTFPLGVIVSTPLWAAESPAGNAVHTATGGSITSVDFLSVKERCVYVGPMDREVLLYDSYDPGNEDDVIGQFAVGAHDPQYFHTKRQCLDFDNAGTTVDVAVVWWE